MYIQIMKNLNKLIFTFISCFVFIMGVNAEETCTYKDKANLNEIASRVKTSYEVVEEIETREVVEPDTGEVSTGEFIKTSFKIGVYNLTEDLYVIQTNNYDEEEIIITYTKTTDGVYTFVTEDTEHIINYKYDVYAIKAECMGSSLKTYTFTKPKLNLYSQYALCDGLDDVPYCQKYITEEIKIPEGNLNTKIHEYINEEKEEQIIEEKNGFLDFIKENYIYVISGGILVGATLVTTIIMMKKRSAL